MLLDQDFEEMEHRARFFHDEIDAKLSAETNKQLFILSALTAAFLPPAFSSGFVAALLVLVFCVEAGWYGLVAVVLSADAPQRAYLSCKAWVDRAAGAVLLGLGLRLVAGAAREP